METLKISFHLSRFPIIKRLFVVVVYSRKAEKENTNTIQIPYVEGLRCSFPLKPENLKVLLFKSDFLS